MPSSPSISEVVEFMLVTMVHKKIPIGRMRETFSRSPVLGELVPSPVRLGDSPISGNGLFATRDIQAGEILTFYPCDVYIDKVAEGGSPGKVLVTCANVADRSRVQALVADATYRFDDRDFAFIGDPKMNRDPWFLGHMANDSVCIKGNGDQDLQRAIIYTKCALQHGNAEFTPVRHRHHTVSIGIESVRSISAGDEILVGYGPAYWLAASGVAQHDIDQIMDHLVKE
jgi:hypothetical protein